MNSSNSQIRSLIHSNLELKLLLKFLRLLENDSNTFNSFLIIDSLINEQLETTNSFN